MTGRTSLVLLYTPNNRFSFNVLVGVLESDPYFDKLNIFFEPGNPALFRRLRELEKEDGRTVAAFSFATPQYFKIRETLFHLRHKFRKPVLVAGGPHPSGLPEPTLNLGFDYIVSGEGERSFIRLMKALMDDEDPSGIPGLAFKDESGKFRLNPAEPPASLDDFPPFAAKHGLFNPIEISRGCVHGCAFCQTSRLLGRSMRHRSVENICGHVRTMVRHGITDVRFVSPDGFAYGSIDGRESGAMEIEKLLKSVDKVLNGKGRIFFGAFPSEARPEHVTMEKLDLVKRFASNTNLILGAQTGSERLLKLCGRGHTVEDILEACELTVRSGLSANVDIVFGLPGENGGDRRKTVNLIRKLSRTGVRVHGHFFMPLAGTAWWNKKPEFPETKFLKQLDTLSADKVLWGSWRMQASLSRKIYEHFKNT